MVIKEKFLDNTRVVLFIGLVICCIGSVIYVTRNTDPKLKIKKEKILIEYGEVFNSTFEDFVETRDLDKEDINFLRANVKIKSNVKNEVDIVTNEDGTMSERDKGYAKVGDYKVTLTYKKETKAVKVTVKDTVAPELLVPENTEILKGTNLTTFDFNSIITVTDLATLNELVVDYSNVDANVVGEYVAKASIEDVNHNKAEKEFKVTIIAPTTNPNEETTTEIQTDPTTGQKKTVVITKPKETTTSNNTSTPTPPKNNTPSNGSGSSNTKPSTGGSTGGSSSKPSTGGNTGGSTNGNNGGDSKPAPTPTPTPEPTPIPEKKKYYWAECWYCHYRVESDVSMDDVLYKLTSSFNCTGNSMGEHRDYHYGTSHR